MLEWIFVFLSFMVGSAVDAAMGGGGGFLIVPSLVVLDIEPVVAVASLLTAFLGALVGALFRLRKSDYFQFSKSYAVYIGLSCLGGVVGVFFSIDMDPEVLKRMIAVLLLGMLCFWFFSKKGQRIRIPCPRILVPLLFFVTGIYTALVGSGAGFVLTFLFLFLTGKGLKEVMVYRLVNALLLVSIIAGFYLWHGKVDFSVAGIGFIAALIGGYLGIHYVIRIPEKLLKILFALLTLVSLGLMMAS